MSLYFHLQITGVLISRNTCLHVQAKTDSGNYLVFCSVGSSGVKWPGREADGSPISSAEVRNILNGNTVPPQLFVKVNVSVCGLLTLRFGLPSLGSLFDAHRILLTVGLGSFQGRSGNFEKGNNSCSNRESNHERFNIEAGCFPRNATERLKCPLGREIAHFWRVHNETLQNYGC